MENLVLVQVAQNLLKGRVVGTAVILWQDMLFKYILYNLYKYIV